MSELTLLDYSELKDKEEQEFKELIVKREDNVADHIEKIKEDLKTNGWKPVSDEEFVKIVKLDDADRVIVYKKKKHRFFLKKEDHTFTWRRKTYETENVFAPKSLILGVIKYDTSNKEYLKYLK